MSKYKKFDRGYIVVPANKKDDCNKRCEDLLFGPNFFSIPIYQGNSRNPTHYGASANLNDEQWKQLKLIVKNISNAVSMKDKKAVAIRDDFEGKLTKLNMVSEIKKKNLKEIEIKK